MVAARRDDRTLESQLMPRRAGHTAWEVQADAYLAAGRHGEGYRITDDGCAGRNRDGSMSTKGDGAERACSDARRIGRHPDGDRAEPDRRSAVFVGKANAYLFSADRHTH